MRLPRPLLWTFVILVLGAIAVAATLASIANVPFSSEILRRRVIDTLSDRLDASVELGDLKLKVFPELHAEGKGLHIRHRGRVDIPPLISIDSFVVDATIPSLWRKHVTRVRLNGLDIQIPPRQETSGAEVPKRPPDDPDADSNAPAPQSGVPRGVIVDELIADEAKLTLIPREADKKPKVWVMHELHVLNVGAGEKMPFASVITNAIPPGDIDTTGEFGPWNPPSPALTPLAGDFVFRHADLGVFGGISGILSAHGKYGGALGRIDVTGETETPDFMVNISHHRVPLNAAYHAIVDGTNGDTTLAQIDASLLNTLLVAKGGVYDVKGVDGRLVTLDVSIEKGRIEDLMRLAVNTPKPPMIGGLKLRTKFDLPPGPRDVVDKLKLNGQFSIASGRFTDATVQQKINDLSRRASGKPPDQSAERVASNFSGGFVLGSGVLALRDLTFDIPGAVVQLDGRYTLRPETLQFSGKLLMDAKISQTTSGFKSLLLKIVDPLFRRNGRTVIPIKVTGTRNNPSFGVDVGRVFKRD